MDMRYLDQYLSIARELREAGINTETYLEAAKLGNQLAYAEKKGFHIALIAGENEFERNVVQVKNLMTRTAENCSRAEVLSAVRNTLRGAQAAGNS
jgi:histidyl-tRNA synthetase